MLILHISGTSSFLCGSWYYHRFFDPWVSILFPMCPENNLKVLYSIFLTIFSMWNFRRLNMAKEAQCASQGLDDSHKGEFVEFGSESPLFRFVLYICLAWCTSDVLREDIHYERHSVSNTLYIMACDDTEI